eukprot:1001968-Prymnesium_polylepis.1
MQQAADGPIGLLLGTLNLLADQVNPVEFIPNDADVLSAGLSKEEFDAALQHANLAFRSYTLSQALEEAAQAPAVLRRLQAFVNDDERMTSGASTASLIAQGILDLHLDNKWVPRHNPLTCWMASTMAAL